MASSFHERIVSANGETVLHKYAFFVYNSRMNTLQFKGSFLKQVGDFRPLQQLLDLLPDVAFFIKDRKSRIVMKNRRCFECCGVSSEEETIGKVGHEFFSGELMALYLKQDRQVMKTGTPIINAMCPSPMKGSNAMIIFSKVPLRDRQGRIIGLAGLWREVKGLPQPLPRIRNFSRAVEMMHARYAEPLAVKELAKIAGVSRSQFIRQFHRLFGAAPHEYLLRVRVNAAAHLLAESALKTTDIALQTGFYDHSHFSRTFRHFMGVSPSMYRRRQMGIGL